MNSVVLNAVKESIRSIKFSFRDFLQYKPLFRYSFYSTHHYQPFIEDYFQRLIELEKLFKVEHFSSLEPEVLRKNIVKLAEANRFYNGLKVNIDYYKNMDSVECIMTQENVKNKQFEIKDAVLSIIEYEKPCVIYSKYFNDQNLIDFLQMQKPEIYDYFIVNPFDKTVEETLKSNFILKKDNNFIIPSMSDYCIKRILFNKIIEILSRPNFSYKIKKIKLEDLNNADAILLINDIDGLLEIKKVLLSDRPKFYLTNEFDEILEFLNQITFNSYN